MKNILKHIRTAAQKMALALLVFCLTAALLPDVTAKAALMSSYRMNIGEVRTVTTEAGGTNYIWSSSDLSVLDVRGNGSKATFSALKAGTARVTVTCTRQKPDLAWNPVTETYDHTTVPYQDTDMCVVLVVDPDAPAPPVTTNPSKGKVGENVTETIEDIGGFGGGLVPVKRDGLWGFANGKLQLAIPFQYDDAFAFSEGGIAYVKIGDNQCVIDKMGNVVYQDSGIGYKVYIYTYHTYFQVKRYFSKDTWEWEHYDLNGQQIGKTKLEADGKLKAGWGDLNYWATDQKNENWVFFRPDDYSFDENKAALKIPVIKGIDVAGDGIRPVVGDANAIQEGLLVVSASDTGKRGAIDQNGQLVIPCEYDKLFASRSGFLAYKKGNECGLLKNPVTPPKAVPDIVPEKPGTVTPPGKETEGTEPASKVAKVTQVSAKSTAKGKVTVTWKRAACDGFQIACSRAKSFSPSKTQIVGTGGKTSKKTIKGLAKGKTYYVRVRAYKKVNGKTYYGAWSTVRKVKIKK